RIAAIIDALPLPLAQNLADHAVEPAMCTKKNELAPMGKFDQAIGCRNGADLGVLARLAGPGIAEPPEYPREDAPKGRPETHQWDWRRRQGRFDKPLVRDDLPTVAEGERRLPGTRQRAGDDDIGALREFEKCAGRRLRFRQTRLAIGRPPRMIGAPIDAQFA